MRMTTIVIDNGTDTCKAGFADDEAPTVVHPTVVGSLPTKSTMVGTHIGEPYVDFNPKSKVEEPGVLKYPIQKGIVVDWDAMQKLWHELLREELKIQHLEEHGVLLTETFLNPKANKEKMLQMMFEVFNVRKVCIEKQAVLSLYGTGRTSGLVVDVGEGVANVVPVHDGYGLQSAIMEGPISGQKLTDHLIGIIRNKVDISERSVAEIARNLKEELCYVALDYEKEVNSCCGVDEIYTLPDGKKMSIMKHELFKCPEILFQPNLAASESLSVQESVRSSIDRIYDPIISNTCSKNIVLTGGSTLFLGFPEKLHKEISKMVPDGKEVKVVAPPMRRYLTWLGGSIMASMEEEDPKLWYTREEYEESGPSLVYRSYKRKGTKWEKKY